MNQVVEAMLRVMFFDTLTAEFTDLLPEIQFTVLTTVLSTTGLTPSEVIYGFKVNKGKMIEFSKQVVTDLNEERAVLRQQAADAIRYVGEKVSIDSNEKKIQDVMNVGDFAFLLVGKGRAHRIATYQYPKFDQQSLALSKSLKSCQIDEPTALSFLQP